jgi:hypothetical protein
MVVARLVFLVVQLLTLDAATAAAIRVNAAVHA